MTKKKDEPFSHSRWNEPLKPHLVVKSECSPEMYEVIHKDLLECLKKGTITQEYYDYFENN